MAEARDPLVVNRAQLAAALKVSPPTVSTWVESEDAPCRSRGSRGKSAEFYLPDILEWYHEKIRREASEEAASKKLSDRRNRAEVEMLELKLQKERNETMPRSVVASAVRDVAARLAVEINQMPEREAETVIGIKTREGAVAALTLVAEGLRSNLRVSEKWLPPESPRLELTA